MMKGLVVDPGSFRQGPVGMIRENNIFHEAPHWKKVESMMLALFHYLNESDDHFNCNGQPRQLNSRLEAAPTESLSNGNLDFPDTQVLLF